MIKSINFSPGDIVKVSEKIKERNVSNPKEAKTRIQIFEGVVIGIRGRDDCRSFTIRKVIDGIGVEKIWPVNSVSIEKVTVKEHSKKKIRRAKLYYLRNQTN